MVHTPGVTKLVRDNIEQVDWPDKYGGNKNKVYLGKVADQHEYLELLGKKLFEEVAELLIATRKGTLDEITEEAGDVIEVVRAIGSAYNIPMRVINDKRLRKFDERGGFFNGITYSGP